MRDHHPAPPAGPRLAPTSGPSPAPARVPQPTRWKMWLLLVGGIYPIITLLALLAEPLLKHLPLPLRFALIVPIMVAVMIWVVLPLLQRGFGAWLIR